MHNKVYHITITGDFNLFTAHYDVKLLRSTSTSRVYHPVALMP